MSTYKQLEDILKSLRLSETAEYLPELLKKADNQALSYTQLSLRGYGIRTKKTRRKADREKDEMGYVPQLSNSE